MGNEAGLGLRLRPDASSIVAKHIRGPGASNDKVMICDNGMRLAPLKPHYSASSNPGFQDPL